MLTTQYAPSNKILRDKVSCSMTRDNASDEARTSNPPPSITEHPQSTGKTLRANFLRTV